MGSLKFWGEKFHLVILYPDQPNNQPSVRVEKKIFSAIQTFQKFCLLIHFFLKVTKGCISPKRSCKLRKRKARIQRPQAQHREKAGRIVRISVKGNHKLMCCRSESHSANWSRRVRVPGLSQLKKNFFEQSITWCVWIQWGSF